jgi:hypothetical protein
LPVAIIALIPLISYAFEYRIAGLFGANRFADELDHRRFFFFRPCRPIFVRAPTPLNPFMQSARDRRTSEGRRPEKVENQASDTASTQIPFRLSGWPKSQPGKR